MLVLTRKMGESINVITPEGILLEVVVTQIKGKQVRIGIAAPEDTKIYRPEVIGRHGKNVQDLQNHEKH